MAVYGVPAFTENNVPELIGIKSNIGGFFFDAILRTSHTSKLKITEHPVEEGAAITDHSFVEPQAITIEVGMSDACKSFVDGQFNQSYTRSVSAFDTLKKLQEQRIPLTVHTRLCTYNNMLVETITVPDDYTSLYGLKATVGLREIIVVSTRSVSLPNRTSRSPHKTGETKGGQVQAENVSDKSLLASLGEKIGLGYVGGVQMGDENAFDLEEDNAVFQQIYNAFSTPNKIHKCIILPPGYEEEVEKAVFVNGEIMPSPIEIINDSYYIALREVCEALNYTVIWDGDNRLVTIENDGQFVDEFYLVAGSGITPISYDINLILLYDRIYMPTVYYLKKLNKNVEIDGTQNIVITTKHGG